MPFLITRYVSGENPRQANASVTISGADNSNFFPRKLTMIMGGAD